MTSSKVHVINILDASGSMRNFANDTIGGFNALIDGLLDDAHLAVTVDSGENPYRITTIVFSSHDFYRKIHDDVELSPACHLTQDDYVTKGMTALYDAVGRAITDFCVGHIGDLAEDERVVVNITTDGEENGSIRFDGQQVRTLITKLTDTGKWVFQYMSQGIDSWAQAQHMGVRANTYAATGIKRGDTISAGYRGMMRNTSRVRASGAAGQSLTGDVIDWMEEADKGLVLPEKTD